MASSELMRTSLYAGGTSPVKMIQAGFYNEDCIVYDLEDSVSAGEKDAARFLVYNLVKYQRPKNKYVVVRVNGLYSEYLDEDLTASLGAQRTKPGWEIFYARNAILMACRAAGISAQDAVFSDINDKEGLQRDLEMTRTLGFDGKTCVHPRQIDAVNACFTPSAKEIRNAERVLAALDEAAKNHTGVCTLDGSMVDKPMELRARTTLAKAAAAGIKIGGVQA